MKRPCFACGSTQRGNEYQLAERMFGTGERFSYDHCADCLSLQIQQMPEDMTPYYPQDEYYSYASPSSSISPMQNIRSHVTRIKNAAILRGLIPLPKNAPRELKWLRKARVSIDADVLDVGCGGGQFLSLLSRMGLRSLRGIDPFLKEEEVRLGSIVLEQNELSEVDGVFDLITLHHTIEHLRDPRELLLQASERLRKGGTLLVRTPSMMCFAWEHYKEYWAQLDAPRHLHIFSPKGFEQLANDCGFEIIQMDYDSTSFQFWASEQYQKGVPLYAENSAYHGFAESTFSEEELQRFEDETQELNRSGRGDQFCAYLKKIY